MIKRRPPIRLKAHHNVLDLAEERRLREGELLDDMGFRVMFIGFASCKPEEAPPAAPERRQRLKWLRTVLGLGKRSRAS